MIKLSSFLEVSSGKCNFIENFGNLNAAYQLIFRSGTYCVFFNKNQPTLDVTKLKAWIISAADNK